MPNSYFQFKQFTVHQDKCAMKVTTDACLFGAWCAFRIQNSKLKIQNALDIGAGTGLLSLMIAQKNECLIDAVEIDADASIQTQENFEASSWRNRLQVHHSAIQDFAKVGDRKSRYDVIISNPPFFRNDLKSEDEKRNTALHSSALSLEELFSDINILLSPEGSFFLLLPYHRIKEAEITAAAHSLYATEVMHVRQTSNHDFFRTMYIFRRSAEPVRTGEIPIKHNDTYSDAFIELLQDYYLYL